MILLIDHYDSFTYNLVQAFGKFEKDIVVKRYDELSIEAIEQLNPDHIVISSGPGRPAKEGVTCEVIRFFSGKVPILGVGFGCLSIAEAFGGKVGKTENLLPGKPSDIFHDGKSIFDGMQEPFSATRYHSLIVSREDFPGSLGISAWSSEDEIMGIRHNHYSVEGVQFNPESIMTEAGEQLLKNFIEIDRVAVN